MPRDARTLPRAGCGEIPDRETQERLNLLHAQRLVDDINAREHLMGEIHTFLGWSETKPPPVLFRLAADQMLSREMEARRSGEVTPDPWPTA